MAKAIITTRNSRTADRRKPAEKSPFRSKRETTRLTNARKMVAKRTEELVRLEVLAERPLSAQQRRVVQQRITATRNNLNSWMDYLTGQNEMDEACYREPRAVIIP